MRKFKVIIFVVVLFIYLKKKLYDNTKKLLSCDNAKELVLIFYFY